jgi:hypothetical protein
MTTSDEPNLILIKDFTKVLRNFGIKLRSN